MTLAEDPEGQLLLAAELGFEPRQTVSETGVLPLHNSAMSINDQRSIANRDMKINTFLNLAKRSSILTVAFSGLRIFPGIRQNARNFFKENERETVLLRTLFESP